MKIKKINNESIEFDNAAVLESIHEYSCCEYHWLNFMSISVAEIIDLEFDDPPKFERVKDYGIRLIAKNGYPIAIPGYGDNNGYYSDNLVLKYTNKKNTEKSFIIDITECQHPEYTSVYDIWENRKHIIG